MSGNQETATRLQQINIPESLAARLYREAGAERFGLYPAGFRGRPAKRSPANTSPPRPVPRGL